MHYSLFLCLSPSLSIRMRTVRSHDQELWPVRGRVLRGVDLRLGHLGLRNDSDGADQVISQGATCEWNSGVNENIKLRAELFIRVKNKKIRAPQ